MQYFLLLTNPQQCSLFWDHIPECKPCFCVNLCHPYGPYSIRPIQQLLYCQTTTRGGSAPFHSDGEQPKTALWLCVREMTWYIYTGGVRGRTKAKQCWFKVTRELCWMVSSCSASDVHDGYWTGEFASHLTSTLFHSLVPWWRPRRIRPQRTHLRQFENSAMGTWPINQELVYQTG